MLIRREKITLLSESMAETHTGPEPSFEIHLLFKMIFWGERNQAASSSSSTYWIMWWTMFRHAVFEFGYRAGVAGRTRSRMRLTHLRPPALPLGSSLPLTPWFRIVVDRDGEWELDTAAATSSPKPSSADIFLLCCEGKWEKTNIHN